MSHCIHCGVAGAGQFCASCGRPQVADVPPIAAASPLPSTNQPSMSQKKGMGCASVLGIIVLVCIGVVLLLAALGSPGAGKKSSSMSIGATKKLTHECPALPTKAGWDEFHSAVVSGDHAGASRVILEQDGRFVPAGTPILIRDLSIFDLVEATDQSGDIHMGERLFLSRSCVGE